MAEQMTATVKLETGMRFDVEAGQAPGQQADVVAVELGQQWLSAGRDGDILPRDRVAILEPRVADRDVPETHLAVHEDARRAAHVDARAHERDIPLRDATREQGMEEGPAGQSRTAQGPERRRGDGATREERERRRRLERRGDAFPQARRRRCRDPG